jgi:hypothetical protein
VSGADTVDLVRYDRQDGRARARQRRTLYIAFTTIVTLVMALGVLEAVVGSSVYGVDTMTTSATRDDVQLEVRHATVTRGELAVPLEIALSRPGGFTEPIVLTITSDYLDLFSSQGPDPSPSSETATAEDLILTFDPPPGDAFTVRWDLAAKAVGSFSTRHAHIAVLDSEQNAIVGVDFDTKVRP